MSIYPEESNRIKYPHRRFRREQLKKDRELFIKKYSKSNWETIKIPKHLNLLKKPDLLISTINRAYTLYRKGKNIHYDMKDCIEISPESIAVLVACISDNSFTNGMGSRGNLPQNYFVRNLIKESGFFDHVRLINGKHKSKGIMLHKITDNKVETDVAKETCLFVKDKVKADYVDDMEPLYDVLVEVMQNTNNHAGLQEKGKYDWWFYRYEDQNKKIIHFTFLDIGVGIFQSLSVMNYLRKFGNLVSLTSNIDLVDKLVKGEIKSRTGRLDRGKGIPQIFELSKDNLYKDFYVLSNDVLINAKTMEKKKLNKEFYGTLYYFTIEVKKYNYAG
ncbi:hypothetical protein [Tenacibaculum sp. 190524A05c]|uniref:hypothetical protein n=1 Tax=Tenacibaculum platacis TaxID=3137852 RepID=UPI0031FB9145